MARRSARAIVKVLAEDQAAPAKYYSFPAGGHSSDSRLTLFSFVRTLVDGPVRSIAFFDSRSGDVSIAINDEPPRYEVSAATAKRFVAVLEMFSRAEPAHHEHSWGTSYAFPGICKRTARLLPQREAILADVVVFAPDAVGQPAA